MRTVTSRETEGNALASVRSMRRTIGSCAAAGAARASKHRSMTRIIRRWCVLMITSNDDYVATAGQETDANTQNTDRLNA